MQTHKVKFLVVRFSSIGDIVLTTPVIRGLKQQVEHAEVHFLTKKSYFDVVKHNPYIDKIHLFDKDFSELVETLKLEFFDYIIDLHHNLRTTRLRNALGIPSFSFNKLNREKWVMVNFKRNILPDVHIVDRYMDCVKIFDVKNDGKGLDYFIAPEDEVNLSALGLEVNNYTAIVIGATHATKRLPNEKIIEICKKIEGKIVLLGGPDDMENAKIIEQAVTDERLVNTCGQLKLNQSAFLVQKARVVITHDTGLMHIAAAFKKKIISLWGNTIPEFGMVPYYPIEGSEIIEVKGLKCRPCTKIGFKTCPKRHFKCMNEIDVEKIVRIVNSY